MFESFTIKSPLRYPGGKSRAIVQILDYLPNNFVEYREPFVGGGSLFIYLRQRYPRVKFWINDLNFDLYCFWSCAQKDIYKLTSAIGFIKQNRKDGRVLFNEFAHVNVAQLSDFDRAVRFFVLNRITFSGTVDSGGYSQKAFESRFTESSIKRLLLLGDLLGTIKITHLDYEDVIAYEGKDVFTFFDPPYLAATKSRLYGKRGELHTGFDHAKFAQTLRHYDQHWLVTYDNSEQIRKNFEFAHIYEWELQYGMNNYKQGKAEKGKELFISNYIPANKETEQLRLFA